MTKFGAQAIFGRPLTVEEIHAMLRAETVVQAYTAREKAENWVAWAKDNPELSLILNAAAKAAHDGE